MSLLAIPPREPISQIVLDACHHVIPGATPEFVPVHLTQHSEPDACHTNASLMAASAGGSVQQGWSIWEIPDWEVRMEFHSVWRSPSGQLLDTTPPAFVSNRVLFLPDSAVRDTALSVPCHHHPWSDDPFCLEYIEAIRELDQIFFPPDKPPLHMVHLREDEITLLGKRLREIARRRDQGKKTHNIESPNYAAFGHFDILHHPSTEQ